MHRAFGYPWWEGERLYRPRHTFASFPLSLGRVYHHVNSRVSAVQTCSLAYTTVGMANEQSFAKSKLSAQCHLPRAGKGQWKTVNYHNKHCAKSSSYDVKNSQQKHLETGQCQPACILAGRKGKCFRVFIITHRKVSPLRLSLGEVWRWRLVRYSFLFDLIAFSLKKKKQVTYNKKEEEVWKRKTKT